MPAATADQVVDFFDDLFARIFSDAFRPQIEDVLRRKAVTRQVEEAADAASQSLTRFFRNQQLTERQAADILAGFTPLRSLLKLADISNPNVTPEAVVENLLVRSLPIPEAVQQVGQESVFRVALHSIVQVLMLVGPVMAEWQKLKFSSTFELPRRILNRLNQISEQLDALGSSRQAAADERFELNYRDYLLQRFYRVEAGTVRMTTNLDVDLRELFVMPRVLPRKASKEEHGTELSKEAVLMDLAAAREFYGGVKFRLAGEMKKENGVTALEQVRNAPRNVIIGAPGSGKSTFLEWLQLKLAAVEEVLVMAGRQAIPLLLRVRQLDPHNLPKGAAMIEKATASRDRATLMPPGWLERQMKSGRVLLTLDGLDETEPELRDGCILPWLQELCRQYPNCQYLVSSCPVGYPVGALRELEFVECDLLDFGKDEIAEYTRHWCTAIRLARNEPEEEAPHEGEADGKQIVESFEGHPYINNLAQNPLMLSAICLVNYFERGQLPTDRAMLYRLCVEGLLHHWDQRRGIRSEFTLDEKLRVCREVALEMQANDRAEYEAEKVRQIVGQVLNDTDRVAKLLEHIRYRTGLLLERRPGVFAFAHLTFQEYLAARAVHEGNQLCIDARRLVDMHTDGRWKEVIALYCGLAPASATYEVIQALIGQPNTPQLSDVLAEAYLSAGLEVERNSELRRKVLERIAYAPEAGTEALWRFPDNEVAPIANRCVGLKHSDGYLSGSFRWLLQQNSKRLEEKLLIGRLKKWREMDPSQVAELNFLLHSFASNEVLTEVVSETEMYSTSGPELGPGKYATQAEIAAMGLSHRQIGVPIVDSAFIHILRVLSNSEILNEETVGSIVRFLRNSPQFPNNPSTWPEFVSLARQVAIRFEDLDSNADTGSKIFALGDIESAIKAISSWADALEQAIAEKENQKPGSRPKSTKATKQTSKTPPRRER